MKMLVSSAFAIFASSSIALADFDVQPRVENSKIVTDGFSDETGALQPNMRVFGYDFGENIDDPFFVQDPGFNAASGSGLTVGSQFTFSILSSLDYWAGNGAVDFVPVSAGDSIQLNFGAATRTLTGTSGAQSGFNIQTVGSGGALHRHLNTFLLGADGNTVPAGPGSWGAGDGVEATPGIYLFSLQLLLDPAGSVAPSDPIYFVFNNGLDEAASDNAIEWVQENLVVPEPASVPVLMALLTVSRIRRRPH